MGATDKDRLVFHVEPLTKARRLVRTKRVTRCIKILQQLRDQPYNATGERLVVRFPSKFRQTMKTAAEFLKIQIQTEKIDEEWHKVVVRLPEDTKSVFPGQWSGYKEPKGNDHGL